MFTSYIMLSLSPITLSEFQWQKKPTEWISNKLYPFVRQLKVRGKVRWQLMIYSAIVSVIYLNCRRITSSHRICYVNVAANCKVVCQCYASDDATPPPISVSVHSDKPLPKIAELPHRATFIFQSTKYTSGSIDWLIVSKNLSFFSAWMH